MGFQHLASLAGSTTLVGGAVQMPRLIDLPHVQPLEGRLRIRRSVPKTLIDIIGRGPCWHHALKVRADCSGPEEAEGKRRYYAAMAFMDAEFKRVEDALRHKWVFEPRLPARIEFEDLCKPVHDFPGTIRRVAIDAPPTPVAHVSQLIDVTPAAGSVVLFDDVIPAWAHEKGIDPIKGVGTMNRVVNGFCAFLGHRNMAAVSRKVVNAYKTKLIEDPLYLAAKGLGRGKIGQTTIAAHLKLLSALFTYAINNDRFDEGAEKANPCKIEFDPIVDLKKKRIGFSDDDRRKLFDMAAVAKTEIKWLVYLGAATGARVEELASADTRDVYRIGGIWVLDISVFHRTGRLKNQTSHRKVPLHSGLIALGFLDYVRSLPPGPLFPMLPLGQGNRRGDAGSSPSLTVFTGINHN